MNEDYELRIKRINDAIALKKPDTVPISLGINGLPFFISDKGSYKDVYYNHEAASEALKDFYREFMPDTYTFSGLISGRSNEIAGSTMIEWPGKPGTTISDLSSHQVHEQEYLLQEEYPELLRDFTGFMLRKYIPRAFPHLSGLETIGFAPAVILNTTLLAGLYSEQVIDAYEKLKEIGLHDKQAIAASVKLIGEVAEIGIPSLSNGVGEAPFDVLGDYYRGTVGMFDDQLDCPELIAQACDLFADLQIEALRKRFVGVDMPYKRITFPLHKGMDGFVSHEQYLELYWKPLKKIMMALMDIGVTPVLYTEGPYDSRVEVIADIPPGKALYHFEQADMARVKRILGGTVCFSGNFPVYLLEYGTKQQVEDEAKRLIDTCAGDGGYIFDTNMYVENVKRENLETMFETVRSYGKY